MVNDTRCSVEGCDNKVKVQVRGLCGKHYERWRVHGDTGFTLTPTRAVGTPEKRFWAKVDASGDCWEWMSFRNSNGYGTFRADPNVSHVLAHRFSWETLVGPIPDDYVIDHLCRNPSCCNPDHLEPVTGEENTRRGVAGYLASQRAKKITHCPKNHPYSGDNLIIDGGARKCRICKNDGWNRRYWEKKGQKDVE